MDTKIITNFKYSILYCLRLNYFNMKYLITAVLLLFFSVYTANAQKTFTVKQAIKHRNKYITVCDTVYKAELVNENTRLLHLGSASCRHSIHVIQTSTKKMTAATTLMGNPVCVDGIVRYKRGRYMLYTTHKIMYMGPIDM